MSNGFDLAVELAAGVQDRRNAWRFIRGFADSWLAPLCDGDGYSIGELNAAEKRLGFILPIALREAYMLFGKRVDLCATMNHLRSPNDLYVYEDTGVLLYHAENQGCWERYIRLADLDFEDPPTTQSCEWGHKEHAAGVAWSERLSIALIEMVLDESMHTDELTMYGELLEKELPEVERRFDPLGLPLLPLEEPECTLGRRRWYIGEDVILCIDPFLPLSDEQEPMSGPWHRPWSRAGLSIRGRTFEAIHALQKILPREWFHWEWHRSGTPYPPKP